MTTTLDDYEEAMEAVRDATAYTDLFPDVDVIKDVYRQLARSLHPDTAPFGRFAEATAYFQRLNAFKRTAEQMRDEGRFGQPVVLATITTKRARHEIKRKVGQDEMALFYRATTVAASAATDSMVKVARSAKDNDLFAQEARALKKLHAEDDKWTRAYPELLDTFLHSEGRRRTTVTPYYSGFYTAEEIKRAFPKGLDPRHGVWIFRRLLMALGYAHEKDLVHGAVVPSHVLIGPKDHAVVLIDWCYSQVIDDESKTNFIKAVVPMYKQFYPEEVLAKGQPDAATDLYMAAALMTYLMPVAPKPLRAFFKGVTLTKQNMRPNNSWGLLLEFDELLKGIGEPFYPRRFVEFTVPTGGSVGEGGNYG